MDGQEESGQKLEKVRLTFSSLAVFNTWKKIITKNTDYGLFSSWRMKLCFSFIFKGYFVDQWLAVLALEFT